MLETGANVRVAKAPFTALTTDAGSQRFGYGTLFVAPPIRGDIPSGAVALLQEAKAMGARIFLSLIHI